MALDPQRRQALLQQLRELNPDKAAWSDDSLLYQAAVDAQNAGVLGQQPDLDEYLKESMMSERGIGSELAGALGSGVDVFQSKLYDTAALAGDIAGNQDLQAWGEEGRDRNLQEAAVFRPVVDTLERVKSGKDFAYWLTNLVGSQAPQIAGTAAAALGAAALAPETAIAGLGGITVAQLSALLAGGAVGFTQMQNYGDLKAQGGEDVIPLAVANGLIGSALEAVGPARLMNRLVSSGIKAETAKAIATGLIDRVPAPVMRVALGYAKEGSTEMLTEIAQEALTIGTEIVSNRNNPEFMIRDEDVVSRLVNNGVAGFVLGGGLGGTVEALRGGAPNNNLSERPLPMEESTESAPASLEVPVAPLRPSPLAAPAPAQQVATPAVTPRTTAALAPVPTLASAAQVELLVERGIPLETALSMRAEEADAYLAQTSVAPASPAAAPVPAAPVADPTEVAAAQQRQAQAAAQDALRRARAARAETPLPIDDTEARMLRAQEEREREQIRQQREVERAKIVPFPVPQQPGETAKQPTLSQQEIRRRAALYREAGNDEDADFIDLNTLQRFKIREPRTVNPEPAPLAPIEPAPVTPAPSPASTTGSVIDLRGKTLHTLRNESDLPAVLHNGLARGSNVTLDGSKPNQSLGSGVTLVYPPGAVKTTLKEYQSNEGIVNATEGSPIAILIERDSVVTKKPKTVDELESQYIKLTQRDSERAALLQQKIQSLESEREKLLKDTHELVGDDGSVIVSAKGRIARFQKEGNRWRHENSVYVGRSPKEIFLADDLASLDKRRDRLKQELLRQDPELNAIESELSEALDSPDQVSRGVSDTEAIRGLVGDTTLPIYLYDVTEDGVASNITLFVPGRTNAISSVSQREIKSQTPAPQPEPTATPQNVPFVSNLMTGIGSFGDASKSIEVGETVKGARPDERNTEGGKYWTEQMTRNGVIIRTQDGKHVFVPVYRDKGKTVTALLREKGPSNKELLPRIAEEASKRLGSNITARNAAAILQGQSQAAKPSTAERHAVVKEIAQEMGYTKREDRKQNPSLTDFLKERGGNIIGYMQFQNPLPAGARALDYTPENLGAAIQAATERSRAAGVFNDNFGTKRVEKAVTFGAMQGAEETLADENAVTPGQSTPALPAPSGQSLVRPYQEQSLPPVERVGLIEEQLYTLRDEIADDASFENLLSLRAGELTNAFRDDFRAVLSKDQRETFDNMSADEQLSAMRSALAEARTLLDDDTVLHRRAPEAYRAPAPEAEATFDTLLRAAGRLGIDIRVANANESAAHADFRAEGGWYDPTNRTVTLVMRDVMQPTAQNVITALHEIMHDVVRSEPEWVQSALHDMIERLPMGERAYFKNAQADTRLQNDTGAPGMTEERLVEHLTLKGLSTEQAQGLVSRFWRAVKEVFYRAALHLQRAFLGTENASGEMARRYVENKVARILAGDLTARSFLNLFGRKPTMGRLSRLVFDQSTGHYRKFSEGSARYPYSPNGTIGAARYNVMAPLAAFKESVQLDGTVDRLRYEDELADVLYTRRAGLPWNDVVVGTPMNAINWSTIPVTGDATRSYYRLDKKQLTLRLLRNRLLAEGTTAQSPNGRTIHLLVDDYANGTDNARIIHMISGRSGTFESADPRRTDLLGSVHGTLSDPTLIFEDPQHGSTNYVRVLKHADSGRLIHVVAVAERGGMDYVETQYFIGHDKLTDASSGPVIYKKDVPPAEADGTKAPVEGHAQQEGPSERNLPLTDRGPGNVFNESSGDDGVNGVMYRRPPAEELNTRLEQARAESLSRARIDVAVANQLDEVYRQLFEQAKRAYPDRSRDEILADRRAGRVAFDNLTYERFLKMHGVPNPQDVRGETLAALAAQFELELGVTSENIPDISGARIDTLPENERALAEYALAVQLGNHVAKTDAALRESRAEYLNKSERYERHLAEVRSVDANLGNIAETDRMARGYIRSYLSDLKRDLKRLDRDAQALGQANAVLADLEGKVNAELETTFTERVLDSIGVDELPLPSMLKRLFSFEADGFDLAAASPKQIRERVVEDVLNNSDSPLAAAVELGEGPNATARGTALLTTLITFIKQQARLADVLRLQLTETTEAKNQLIRLREVLNETSERRLADIGKAVSEDLRRPGNRVIHNWLKRRDAAVRENAELSRYQQAGELLLPSVNALKEFLNRVDSRRGIGLESPIVPGAQIQVPPSPDASSEEVRGSLVTLSMGREQFLKSEQVRDILRKQLDWLEYRADKPELQDLTYHTLLRAHDKLKLAVASDEINATLGGLDSGYHDSIGEMLRRSGTRSGALGKRMWVRFSQLLRANQVPVVAAGKKFERAAEMFYKNTGLSADAAHEAFYRSAMFFMGRNPALTEDEAFVQLRKQFQWSPIAREVANNSQQWGLFVDWMKAARDNNRLMLGIAQKAGLSVRDEKMQRLNVATGAEEAATRSALDRGVTGYTVPQRVHRQLAALVSTMSERLRLLGDGENNPFSDISLRLRIDPNGVRAALQNFTSPEFTKEFIEPLLTETGQTLVPAPPRADGLKLHIPEHIARDAWDGSGGDVLSYAERIYQAMSPDATPDGLVDYQQQVLSFIGSMFRKLDRQLNSDNPLQAIGVQGVGHFAMDARVADNFPSAWLDYAQFTPEDNRAALHLIAANAAFGRNFNDLNKVYAGVQNELRALANEIARPPEEREQLRKSKPEWFALREEAENALKHAENLPALTQRIFDPDRGGMDEMGPVMEIYGGVVTGMLFGIKSAIKNLISMSDTLLVERSLSRRSLQTVGRGYAAAGRNFLAGIGNVFGADLLRNNRYVSLIEAAGGFDIAPHVSAKDLRTGTRGRNNNFDRTRMGKIQRIARIARTYASNARLGFSKGSAGPALRTFNQFQYTQLLSNYSITEALLKRYEDIALLGADYYAANPEQRGKPLTADKIGYSDKRGFEALREEALDHGFSVEELAEKAVRRRERGREIFDTDTVQKVMNMALDRVSGESSPTNRPSYLLTSRFARANAALIGWSFFKTSSVLRSLRDPRGRRDINTLLNGMKLMTLGVVPLAVAFSLLMDEYDEKLTGKKTSLKPLTEDDFFRALLERSTAMGAFGILGNVPDTVFNLKDGTGRFALSADQSIVWLNSVTQMIKTLGAGYQMGLENLNYANFYRPIAQSLGAGGLLQYVQVANKLFPDDTIQNLPVFSQEAGATARTNAGNYLRAAGRSLGLEVRLMGGSSTPNSVTPWVTNMTLAAYRDDPEEFRKAYRGAIKAATEMGKPDPVAYVKQAFTSRHPLKSIFRTAPSVSEVARLTRMLSPVGQESVRSAVDYFNRYGSVLGIKPYVGSTERSRPTQAIDIASIRARMAAQRMGEDI